MCQRPLDKVACFAARARDASVMANYSQLANGLSFKAIMCMQLFVCEIVDFELSAGSEFPCPSPMV